MNTVYKKINSGFTLIELVIYIALISVLIVVISQIFMASLDVQLESESVSSVDQDRRYVFNRLAYDISRAESVNAPVTFGTSSSVLTLTINGQLYTYSKNGDRMTLTTPTGIDSMTSTLTRVDSLSFEKIGNATGLPTVRVTMTLTSEITNDTGPETETFQSTFGVR